MSKTNLEQTGLSKKQRRAEAQADRKADTEACRALVPWVPPEPFPWPLAKISGEKYGVAAAEKKAGVGQFPGSEKKEGGADVASATPSGWIREEEAAYQLGVTREVLRALRDRDLQKDLDWKKEGREILLARDAYERIRKTMGLRTPPDESNAAGGATAAQAEPEELTVLSVPSRNTRILLAMVDPEKPAVRVRVRDNRNFLPGMTFKATRDRSFDDVYVLEGRCPRYRGRW